MPSTDAAEEKKGWTTTGEVGAIIAKVELYCRLAS